MLLLALALATAPPAWPHAVRPSERDTIPALPDSLSRVCRKELRDVDLATIQLQAHADDPFTPTVFCFRAAGKLYVLSSSGEGQRGSTSWSLPLEQDFELESFRYGLRGPTLYVLYQASDGEDGMGYLFALNASTLEPAWQKPVPVSINLAPPLLAGPVAYLAGLDAIMKVDLAGGRLLWKHTFYVEDLQAASHRHYTSFGKPWRSGQTVYFAETGLTRSTPVDTISVSDSSSQILTPATWMGHRSEP